jgi:uncharacterized protein YifE (UPF0438 family)
LIEAASRAAEARPVVSDQHELIARLRASKQAALDAEQALRKYISELQHPKDGERKLSKKRTAPEY